MVACSWMSAPVPLPAPKPSCLSHLDVAPLCVFWGNVEGTLPVEVGTGFHKQVTYGICIYIYTKHSIYGMFAYIWLIFYGKCTAKYTIRGGGFKCFF